MRVLFSREDDDGSIVDGTAEITLLEGGGWSVSDFRTLAGEAIPFGPGDELVLCFGEHGDEDQGDEER